MSCLKMYFRFLLLNLSFRGLFFLSLLLGAAPAWAVTDTWSQAGALTSARYAHAATLLPSGRVLAVGGVTSAAVVDVAELYDPAANRWSAATAPAATIRVSPSVTLLPSGKVLVVGGADIGGAVASAELYDPATNSWSTAGTLATPRRDHTATLLASGRVLVAAGQNSGGAVTSAELYDPATNSWSMAGTLAAARFSHTATLLPSGQVLLAGGQGAGAALSSAERYDPASNSWSGAGTLAAPRVNHTATLLASGDVLLAGGSTSNGDILASAELYDPAANNWRAAGALATARRQHTATLLPSGNVLAVGGIGDADTLASVELYDPSTNSWRAAGALNEARGIHTAALLPSGRVLVAGGEGETSTLASAELYDPAAGAWSAAGALLAARGAPTLTPLASGQVLMAGGNDGAGGAFTSSERYDPVTNSWSAAGTLTGRRGDHSATLLPSGQVLVAGGYDSGNLASAERYDPTTNTWSPAGALTTARYSHSATLLQSGRVLVTGGYSGAHVASTELYDPATNSWTTVAPLPAGRRGHSATLLASGRVLVAGGYDGSYLARAELYDPATDTWSAAAALGAARTSHTATLLPSGKVLVVGGTDGAYLGTAELYDPVADSWSSAGAMAAPRIYHNAILLPSGQVLVAGGYNNVGVSLSTAELYDPATNQWSATASLATPRYSASAALLSSGEVLVAGGYSNGYLASAERYDPGLAPVAALKPALTTTNAFLLQAGALVATSTGSATSGNAATATGFMPRREASGGAAGGNSASNAPVFQVQRIDNEQMRFVANDASLNMSDTLFTGSANALAGFPAGPVRVRVWVNGVPSAARYSNLATPPGQPIAPTATGGVLQASVAFDPPAGDGGAPITSYTATATPGGATASCTAPCSSIAFDPMLPGSYTFTIHATNAAGAGPESAASNTAIVTRVTPLLSWPAPAAIVYGTALSATQLNATASDGSNPVSGTFVYTPAAGVVPNAGGAQVLSVVFTPADTISYDSASADVLIDVARAPLTITPTAGQSKVYGASDPAAFTYGQTGLVSPDTLSGNLARGAGENVGSYAYSPGTLAVSAPGNYDMSLAAGSFAIVPANTTTTILPPGTVHLGQGVVISVVVAAQAPGAGTPGGVVTVADGSASCVASLDPTGAASCTLIPPAPAGNHPIVASYAATANFTASSGTATLTVNAALAGTALTSSVNPSLFGQSVVLTATVTPQAGNPTPTGTIDFTDGGTPIANCSGRVLSNGQATCTTALLSSGSHALQANYAGDINTAASSGTLTQIVNPAPANMAQPVPLLSERGLAFLVALILLVALRRIFGV